MATKKEQVAFELENPGGFVTQASQIGMDGKSINQQIAGRDTKVNYNSGNIESKFNAMIDCMQLMIQGVVFHSGTPFVSPAELNDHLELLRISNSSTSAKCGQAVCGVALCGTN